MMFLKFVLSLLLLITSCLCAVSIHAKTVEFNTQEFPPYSFQQNGELIGPFPDVIQSACELLRWQCNYRLHYYWGTAIRSVKQGESDALFVVGKNNDREKWLRFSVPLMAAEYGFFVSASKVNQLQHLYDLSGLIIGVYAPSNTAYQLKQLSRKLVANGLIPIDIRWQYSTADAIVNLLNGNLDLVYSNKLVGEALNKQIIGSEKIVYIRKQIDLSYYIGFNKRRFSAGDIKEFNEALKLMERRGILAKIFAQYNLPYIKP